MKKKRNIQFKVSDFFVIILCLAVVYVSIRVFFLDLNKTLIKQNEQPIATITFKYNTAQRKLTDRVVWDRLQNNSEVYNGDTIRTSSLSEATVYFTDGTVISLYENTMAKIDFQSDKAEEPNSLASAIMSLVAPQKQDGDEQPVGASVKTVPAAKKINLEFSKGSVSVDTSESVNKVALASGSSSIEIESGSRIHAESAVVAAAPVIAAGSSVIATEAEATAVPAANSLKLQVFEGTAALQTEDGVQQIKSGSAIEVVESVPVQKTSEAAVIPVKTVREFNFVMMSPQPDVTLLNQTQGALPVKFNWKATDGDSSSNSDLSLEIASENNFTNIFVKLPISSTDSTSTASNSIDVPLKEGKNYWRVVRNNSAETVSSGKLTIINAAIPESVIPAPSYVYLFRTKKPAIKFLWNGNNRVTSYKLEIADNNQMNNPVEIISQTSSCIVSSLGTGVWYWRVIPYYTINNIGYAEPSAVSSFTIEQRESLLRLKTFSPQDGSVSDCSTTGGGINFSWQNDTEAASYTFIVASNPELKEPVLSRSVLENWYMLDSQFVSANLGSGQWYWGVYQTDTEGNNSEISDICSFLTAEGGIQQRLVSPSDGYAVADTKASSMLLSWKTSFPKNTRLQIANNPEFNSPVVDEINTVSSYQNKITETGKWYWRIITEVGSKSEVSPVRTFTIVPPLEKPVQLSIPQSGIIESADNELFKFEWKPVKDATYYQMSIFENEDSNEPLYENTYMTNTFASVLLNDYSTKQYVLKIQAFGEDSLLCSVRTGMVSETVFTIKKNAPAVISVKRLMPANMIKITGGTYMMGNNSSVSTPDEKLVHKVTVDTFYMSKYEVTQLEWRTVMKKNNSNFKGDNLPVENVTWLDAVEFCNKLSEAEGLTPCYKGSGSRLRCVWNADGYRLPTEAEWEYAARGGPNQDSFQFSGSDDVTKVAWYDENSRNKTRPVGSKNPNSLGLYDMSGNVFEWCWDIYGEYTNKIQDNPTGGVSGLYRVTRGGGWYIDDMGTRVSSRSNFMQTRQNGNIGFRVVRRSGE